MKEDLGIARFLMVLASFWPLFVLWGIKGTSPNVVRHDIWALICAGFVIVPNLALYLRYRLAKHDNDIRTMSVVSAKDQREHVIVYLFAVLLPLFDANQNTSWDLAALVFALVVVVGVFYHLNLHYLNLAFSFRGLRYYTVVTEVLGKGLKPERELVVVLSRRADLRAGEEVSAVRISNTVLLELGAGSEHSN
jgi:hypothetical protein